MTSAEMPASASIRSSTASPLLALRSALVAQARISVAPAASASIRNRRMVCDRGVGGLGRDESLAAHDVAEPQHLLLADERLEGAVGAHLGDDEVERVRPEVDRGDPHVAVAYAPPSPRLDTGDASEERTRHAESHRRRARRAGHPGDGRSRRRRRRADAEQLAVIGALAAGYFEVELRPQRRSSRSARRRPPPRSPTPAQRRRVRELLVLVELCRHPVSRDPGGAGRGVLRRAGGVGSGARDRPRPRRPGQGRGRGRLHAVLRRRPARSRCSSRSSPATYAGDARRARSRARRRGCARWPTPDRARSAARTSSSTSATASTSPAIAPSMPAVFVSHDMCHVIGGYEPIGGRRDRGSARCSSASPTPTRTGCSSSATSACTKPGTSTATGRSCRRKGALEPAGRGRDARARVLARRAVHRRLHDRRPPRARPRAAGRRARVVRHPRPRR